MAYTTLENVKTYLGIPTVTTSDDALITNLMQQSIDFIDRYVGYKFESFSDTRYFESNCIIELSLLLDYPLLSISTLTNGDSTTILSSQYRLYPLNSEAKWEIGFKSTSTVFWNFTNYDDVIAVAGAWGLFSSCPSEITHISNRLAAYLYRQKDNTGDLDRTVALASGYLLPQNLPNDLMQVLNKYRRIR